MGYTWRPIEPLSLDWPSWADSEMAAIRVVWKDLQESIGESAAAKLHARTVTEWGVETGIEVAEGLYSLVKSERPLGIGLVHDLHARLLRNVPREFELGQWRVLSNPVGSVHGYCPPEHVAAEMERLLELNKQYEREQIPVEIRAAWLHHRFTQIRPYPDGNGRVARALTTLLLVRAGLFPLIIRREEKTSYLDALEAADRGEDGALIERVRALQRRELIRASEFATEPAPTLDETIRRLNEKLGPEGTSKIRPDVAAMVSDTVTKQMEWLEDRLSATFENRGGFRFKTFVGLSTYLRMSVPEPWRLACTLHGAGAVDSGLAVCVVRLYGPDSKLFVLPDSFLITSAEPLNGLKSRFNKWLEKQLSKALELWQQHL